MGSGDAADASGQTQADRKRSTDEAADKADKTAAEVRAAKKKLEDEKSGASRKDSQAAKKLKEAKEEKDVGMRRLSGSSEIQGALHGMNTGQRMNTMQQLFSKGFGSE